MEMRTTLVLIPAFVMGIPYELPAPKAKVDFQAVCDFYNKEIDKLEENIKKLTKGVDLKSELYGKLNESKSVCGVLAYRVLPDCATKEGMNVFSKLDDDCAEKKTNDIKNTFLRMMKLDKATSGQVIFRSCKDIASKGLLQQFKQMQGLVSGLCDESHGRQKRSTYGGGYYPGGHDPSNIWFQYLLCQEQKITCYFFSQGWNQVDYGQYYLYQNALGADVAKPDDDNLLALALLAGTGAQKYPHPGYPAYSSYRKRRESEEDTIEDESTTEVGGRTRRHATTDKPTTEAVGGSRCRQATTDEPTTEAVGDRKRWERVEDTIEDESPTVAVTVGGRRRRHATTDKPTTEVVGGSRCRQATPDEPTIEAVLVRRRRKTPPTAEQELIRQVLSSPPENCHKFATINRATCFRKF